MMGKNFDDPEVQKYMRWIPYEVVKSKDGKTLARIKKGEGKDSLLSFVEVQSELIRKLKTDAENFIGQKQINSAVITVPTYFKDEERQATKEAANIAGFDNVVLIYETTAVALAYSKDKIKGH